MKKQRGFLDGRMFAEAAGRAILIAIIVAALLGYGVLRGCEYIVTNYAVEVKAK